MLCQWSNLINSWWVDGREIKVKRFTKAEVSYEWYHNIELYQKQKESDSSILFPNTELSCSVNIRCQWYCTSESQIVKDY